MEEHSITLTTREAYIEEIAEAVKQKVKEQLDERHDRFADWIYNIGNPFTLTGHPLEGNDTENDSVFATTAIIREETLIQVAFTVLFEAICEAGAIKLNEFDYYSTPLNHGRVMQYNWFKETLKRWLDENHPGFGDVVLDDCYDCYSDGYSGGNIPHFYYNRGESNGGGIFADPIYQYFFGGKDLWEDGDGFKEHLYHALDNLGGVVILDTDNPRYWYNRVVLEKC